MAAPSTVLKIYDFKDGYYDLENLDIQIESAAFRKDGVEIALLPKGGSTLEIAVDQTEYRGTFEELNKRDFFSNAALPETVGFDTKGASFAEDIEIYKSIKEAILEAGMQSFLRDLTGVLLELDREDMKALLYGKDMVPDEDVISFALEAQNKFRRTGKIPNVALVGEAGTGKTTMAKKLAGKRCRSCSR